MVGPITADERVRLTLWLKLSLVVLIGVSAGLITLLGDTTLVETAVVTVVGLVFGVVVVWVVFPGTGENKHSGR